MDRKESIGNGTYEFGGFSERTVWMRSNEGLPLSPIILLKHSRFLFVSFNLPIVSVKSFNASNGALIASEFGSQYALNP